MTLDHDPHPESYKIHPVGEFSGTIIEMYEPRPSRTREFAHWVPLVIKPDDPNERNLIHHIPPMYPAALQVVLYCKQHIIGLKVQYKVRHTMYKDTLYCDVGILWPK